MKYITIVFAVIFSVQTFGQTQRMNHLETGRTFTYENKVQTIQPLLQEADRQLRTFDYEGTSFTLESAVEQDPGSAQALILRAKFNQMVGRHEEARRDLLLAKSINPYAADMYGGNEGLLNVLYIQPEA